MSGAEQDDICTKLAKDLFKVYYDEIVHSCGVPVGVFDQDDLVERGRQLCHEAMYRACFQECVAKGCHEADRRK